MIDRVCNFVHLSSILLFGVTFGLIYTCVHLYTLFWWEQLLHSPPLPSVSVYLSCNLARAAPRDYSGGVGRRHDMLSSAALVEIYRDTARDGLLLE